MAAVCTSSIDVAAYSASTSAWRRHIRLISPGSIQASRRQPDRPQLIKSASSRAIPLVSPSSGPDFAVSARKWPRLSRPERDECSRRQVCSRSSSYVAGWQAPSAAGAARGSRSSPPCRRGSRRRHGGQETSRTARWPTVDGAPPVARFVAAGSRPCRRRHRGSAPPGSGRSLPAGRALSRACRPKGGDAATTGVPAWPPAARTGRIPVPEARSRTWIGSTFVYEISANVYPNLAILPRPCYRAGTSPPRDRTGHHPG